MSVSTCQYMPALASACPCLSVSVCPCLSVLVWVFSWLSVTFPDYSVLPVSVYLYFPVCVMWSSICVSLPEPLPVCVWLYPTAPISVCTCLHMSKRNCVCQEKSTHMIGCGAMCVCVCLCSTHICAIEPLIYSIFMLLRKAYLKYRFC